MMDLQVNAEKFPAGFAPLSAYAHARSLKIGIYTAVSARTCGGYIGSLGYEAVDAASFVAWGFDAVKHDTCGTDCGIHTGCLQNSTLAMFNALDAATPAPVLYYIDSGNPTPRTRG
jgi:alpha-galactosidase